MVDNALKNAETKKKQLLEQRDRLRAELDEVGKSLARVEAFIHNWHAFAAGDFESPDSEGAISADSVEIQRGKGEQKKVTGNSSKEDVAVAARRLIGARGAPIPRKELLKLLLDEGLKIEGSDQEKVLSTMLWRMRDKITNIPRVGYWFPEVDYEPAQYSALFGGVIKKSVETD